MVKCNIWNKIKWIPAIKIEVFLIRLSFYSKIRKFISRGVQCTVCTGGSYKCSFARPAFTLLIHISGFGRNTHKPYRVERLHPHTQIHVLVKMCLIIINSILLFIYVCTIFASNTHVLLSYFMYMLYYDITDVDSRLHPSAYGIAVWPLLHAYSIHTHRTYLIFFGSCLLPARVARSLFCSFIVLYLYLYILFSVFCHFSSFSLLYFYFFGIFCPPSPFAVPHELCLFVYFISYT